METKAFFQLFFVVALFVRAGHAQIDDNFNDNSLNSSIWNTLTPSPGTTFTVSETNQRLEVTLGPGFGGAGIVSACQFTGDFDGQVDYILLNWPATNLHSVRLGAPDLGEGPGGGVARDLCRRQRLLRRNRRVTSGHCRHRGMFGFQMLRSRRIAFRPASRKRLNRLWRAQPEHTRKSSSLFYSA